MRVTWNFSDIDKIWKHFEELNDTQIDKTMRKILTETHNYLQPRVNILSAPHERSGRMNHGLYTQATVERVDLDIWQVGIGFVVRVPGGDPSRAFHSIFIMHGTPRIRPNEALRDSVFGAPATKRLNKEVNNQLELLLGG